MTDASANARDATAPMLGFARRGLLSTAGIVVGAAATGPPGSPLARTAAAQPTVGVAGPGSPAAAAQGTALDQECRRRALEIRVDLAKANAETPAPPHPDNGDEGR